MAKYDRFLKSVGAWIAIHHNGGILRGKTAEWEAWILPVGREVPHPAEIIRYDLAKFRPFRVTARTQRALIRKYRKRLKQETFREQVAFAMSNHFMDQLGSLAA